jgi:hypothetical protein
MLAKMRAHAGPWYVLEHLRPFPGVSLERIIRQINRGVLTETSIIRGPATEYQWRFAVETPGICRYFGKCWKCQGEVNPADQHCPGCLAFLAFVEQPPLPAAPMEQGEEQEPLEEIGDRVPSNLEALSAALGDTEFPQRDRIADDPPRVGGIRATWIAIGMLIIVIIGLVLLTKSRGG